MGFRIFLGWFHWNLTGLPKEARFSRLKTPRQVFGVKPPESRDAPSPFCTVSGARWAFGLNMGNLSDRMDSLKVVRKLILFY